MNGIFKVLLTLLVIIGFSCSSKYVAESDSIQEDQFDKALSFYTQGLLTFDEYHEIGLGFLLKAALLAPDQRELVDDFIKYAHLKTHNDDFSSNDNSLSGYEKLHLLVVNSFKKFSEETSSEKGLYLRLKLLESLLALNRHEDAQSLLSKYDKQNSPLVMLAQLKYHHYKKDGEIYPLLKQLCVEPQYINNSELQYQAIKILLESGQQEHQSQLLKHCLQLISLLPARNQRSTQPNLCQNIINGILSSSDLGAAAKAQCLENLNFANEWSLLAGILMKFEHYEQAYVVIQNKVIFKEKPSWVAYYNLSSCAAKLGKNQERIIALEKALQLKPKSWYLRYALSVAHRNQGNFKKSLSLTTLLESDKSLSICKLKFSLFKDLHQYENAFLLAEKIYHWPDPARRMTAITPYFSLSTIPLYLKRGKKTLLLDHLKKAIQYNKYNISFHNSVAYLLVDADVFYEWADQLMNIVLKAEPDNASYLDTLAWLRYKQQRFPEALTLITRTLKLQEKKSAVIYLHAGDIFLANNKQKEAHQYWQQALNCDIAMQSEIDKRMNRENPTD